MDSSQNHFINEVEIMSSRGRENGGLVQGVVEGRGIGGIDNETCGSMIEHMRVLGRKRHQSYFISNLGIMT